MNDEQQERYVLEIGLILSLTLIIAFGIASCTVGEVAEEYFRTERAKADVMLPGHTEIEK